MKKMFSFRLDQEIHDYLEIVAKENYMSITGYLTNLIHKDMENKKLIKNMDEINMIRAYKFNLPNNIDIEKQIEYIKNKIIENVK